MPWLIRKEECDIENNKKPLLFIHTPRCGGTSLNKLFDIKKKSKKGRGCTGKLGLKYFFYRYKLLEKSNFPIFTYENLLALCTFTVSLFIWFFHLNPKGVPEYCLSEGGVCRPPNATISMWVTSSIGFAFSTFIMTAPVSGRIDCIRRLYINVNRILLRNICSTMTYIHGVGGFGYVVHFTAEKMLRYKCVSEEEFSSIDNFTIIRNPFSRMVSIYMYNRYIGESFEHFVENWYKKWQKYSDLKNKNDPEYSDEWNVYCHVLPQLEYTHMNGSQLVKYIIKQEDLKSIIKGETKHCISNGECDDLPNSILDALIKMPHSNKRKRTKPWQDYYNKRSYKLVLEMYAKDFELFGYPTNIAGYPFLGEQTEPIKINHLSQKTDDSSDGSVTINGEDERDTRSMSFDDNSYNSSDDNSSRSSSCGDEENISPSEVEEEKNSADIDHKTTIVSL